MEFAQSGQLLHINTLFPSQQKDGKVKGGIFLIKLKPKSNLANESENDIDISISYENRTGEITNLSTFAKFNTFNTNSVDFYDDITIQKAVLLTRYVNFSKRYHYIFLVTLCSSRMD